MRAGCRRPTTAAPTHRHGDRSLGHVAVLEVDLAAHAGPCAGEQVPALPRQHLRGGVGRRGEHGGLLEGVTGSGDRGDVDVSMRGGHRVVLDKVRPHGEATGRPAP
jgi:hypothetical protein